MTVRPTRRKSRRGNQNKNAAARTGQSERRTARTYEEVYDGGDHEGAVAAEVGVGDVGADDGRHPDCADPVGDVVGGEHRALVQLRREVQHQVGGDAVVGHPLEHLVHCTAHS